MARTAVTLTTLTANTSTADPAGTDIDATNSHSVTPAGPLEEIFLRITNTTSSTKAVTVLAGDSPPALEAGLGDLTVSLTAGNVTPVVKFVGPLTSGRFLQSDGTLSIDIPAGMTGKIAVLRIPRNA